MAPSLSYNALIVAMMGQGFEPGFFLVGEGWIVPLCVALRSGQETLVVGIPVESSLAGSEL